MKAAAPILSRSSFWLYTWLLPRVSGLLNQPLQARRKAWRYLFATAVLGYAIFYTVHTWFGVYIDPQADELRCMPERLFLAYPRPQEFQRGDIVSFYVSDREMLGLATGKRVAKIVRGVPGDRVTSNEQGVWINGVQMAKRHPLTLDFLAQHHKTPVNLDRELQPGELFVLGTMPRAFDSRYWGVLDERRVNRRVLPVL